MTAMSPPLPAAMSAVPVRRRVGGQQFAAEPAGRRRCECRMAVVVVAQAARLVVDDLSDRRQRVADRQDLVDLLLVLARRRSAPRHGRAHRPSRRRRNPHRPAPARRRAPGRRERSSRAAAGCAPTMATLSPAFSPIAMSPIEKARISSASLGPGPALPDAMILVAHGTRAGETPRIPEQILRKGRGSMPPVRSGDGMCFQSSLGPDDESSRCPGPRPANRSRSSTRIRHPVAAKSKAWPCSTATLDSTG